LEVNHQVQELIKVIEKICLFYAPEDKPEIKEDIGMPVEVDATT
jgi:hypothetical protein